MKEKIINIFNNEVFRQVSLYLLFAVYSFFAIALYTENKISGILTFIIGFILLPFIRNFIFKKISKLISTIITIIVLFVTLKFSVYIINTEKNEERLQENIASLNKDIKSETQKYNELKNEKTKLEKEYADYKEKMKKYEGLSEEEAKKLLEEEQKKRDEEKKQKEEEKKKQDEESKKAQQELEKKIEKENRVSNATSQEKAALRKAKFYQNEMSMSKGDIYEQLIYEKFTASEAQFAIDNLN